MKKNIQKQKLKLKNIYKLENQKKKKFKKGTSYENKYKIIY